MAVDVTIRFRGALDADSDTDYQLFADKTTPGTFAQVGTDQDATSPFAPVSTTLNGALTDTATTVTLTDGAAFAEGDIVMVGREPILLGAQATNIFTNCVRGWGGVAVPVAHPTLTPVYKMHESFTDPAVNFGSRHVIRYQVRRKQGAEVSVVTEVLMVQPSPPDTSDWCMVWGVMQDWSDDPQDVLNGIFTIGDVGAFIVATGETNIKQNETFQSDPDGYFEIQVPRSIALLGGGTLEITIPSTGATYTRNITTVPDADSCHWARCSVEP